MERMDNRKIPKRINIAELDEVKNRFKSIWTKGVKGQRFPGEWKQARNGREWKVII